MNKRMIMGFTLLIFSSCGLSHKLTDEQKHQRIRIDHELNKLYNDFSHKQDSLLIEYYKIK